MQFAAGFPGPPPPPAQMVTDLSGLSASQLTPLILDVNGGNGWDIVLSYLENSAAETLLKDMSHPSTGFYDFCDMLDQIADCAETTADLKDFVFNTGDTMWCDEVINDSTNAVYLLSLLANGDEKQFYKNAADLNPNWIIAALHRMGNFGVSDYLSKAYKYLGKPEYEDLLDAFGDSLEFRQSLVLNELHMYGSSRLGMHRPERILVDRAMNMDTAGLLVPVTGDSTITTYAVEYKYFKRTLSYKQFELSNHLGNVLATVLDRKTAVVDTNSTGDTVMYYIADVYTAQTYYAFGSSMPGYSYKADSADGYRFGFNGQERDIEICHSLTNADYWIYDSRICRRWNVDPASRAGHNIPLSPFCVIGNNPIRYIDPNGADWVEGKDGGVRWRENVTAKNYQDKGVLQEGEIYRGRYYQREIIWTNVKVRGNVENGLMKETYHTYGKMSYLNLTQWVDKAFEEMNKNISETGSNPEITKYWQYTQIPDAAAKGDKWAQSVLKEDKTPWCAAFVNYNLETSGIEGTNSALAFSFKNYGQDLGNKTPVYGAIAVMNYSHVGIVVGINNDGRVVLLGGNQGDAVNLSPNGQSSVIKYVYPSGYTSTSLALPKYNLKGRSLTNETSR